MNNITWHCELIIKNDPDCNDDVQCLTSHVMHHVYHDCHGRAFEDQRRIRIYVLAQFIRYYVEVLADSENEHRGYDPMTEELITGALQEINFREIAENLIGDYAPKSPEAIAEYEEYFNIRGFANYDIDED